MDYLCQEELDHWLRENPYTCPLPWLELEGLKLGAAGCLVSTVYTDSWFICRDGGVMWEIEGSLVESSVPLTLGPTSHIPAQVLSVRQNLYDKCAFC